MRAGVTSPLFDHISSFLPTTNLNDVLLKDLKEKCLPHVSYDEIKFVLSYQRVRVHLKSLGVKFIDPDSQELNQEEQQEDVKPLIMEEVKSPVKSNGKLNFIF